MAAQYTHQSLLGRWVYLVPSVNKLQWHERMPPSLGDHVCRTNHNSGYEETYRRVRCVRDILPVWSVDDGLCTPTRLFVYEFNSLQDIAIGRTRSTHAAID